jgi:hypothetical protein
MTMRGGYALLMWLECICERGRFALHRQEEAA